MLRFVLSQSPFRQFRFFCVEAGEGVQSVCYRSVDLFIQRTTAIASVSFRFGQLHPSIFLGIIFFYSEKGGTDRGVFFFVFKTPSHHACTKECLNFHSLDILENP